MATNFWKYTGSEQRRYPDWRLTADPGYVYDFGAGSQPNDGRWVTDPGPATAPPPPVLPGVVPAGPQPGQVPVWDASTASYKPTDLNNPTLTVNYNTDGSVASVVENGVTTSFTYNGDGTVNTQTRNGVTRTFTYSNGNVTGAN